MELIERLVHKYEWADRLDTWLIFHWHRYFKWRSAYHVQGLKEFAITLTTLCHSDTRLSP